MPISRKFWVRALAVTTITAAGIVLSGCSLLNSVTNGSQSGNGPSAGATDSQSDVFTIKVGDCFNDPNASDTVTTVPTVPCTGAHDYEAFASIIVDGTSYPGDTAVQTQGEGGCKAQFQTFVGIAYDSSTLNFSYYYPTQQSWDQRGDREILCFVYAVGTDKKTVVQSTGSLKDAKI